MNYELKDKMQITKDFLNDLEMKSWQEIESLQNQITNIDNKPENIEVIKLLKNLLTSYYVFAGGLENLNDSTKVVKVNGTTDNIYSNKEYIKVNAVEEPTYDSSALDGPDDIAADSVSAADDEDFEPFEYFVDFDEPTGEPLNDDDIYTN
jgi:hypothetical protein